ncbi:hypothetical protein SOVF_064800 isoform A [Spinacia oleracea]|nr:hypothetical protein SOVF_064800 isoform A [Spinacia oleracea]
MDVKELDYVLVSLGLLVFGVYHIWLVIFIKRHPRHTVIGLNAESRCQWVFSLMEHWCTHPGSCSAEMPLSNL